MKSYFIDTNYFLRFLIKDNDDQFNTVHTLFNRAAEKQVQLHTSVIVIFELYWVFLSFYKTDKNSIIRYLTDIMNLGIINMENTDIMHNALELYSSHNIDLEDCYNISYAQEFPVSSFASFDKKAVKIFSSESPQK